jgi:magnesium transporter
VKRGKRLSDTAALPPGTLVHVGQTHTEGVKLTLLSWDQEKLTVKENPGREELAGLTKAPAAPLVHWLRVEGLAPVEDIAAVGQAFCLHPLVLEDIVNTHQRPKLEEFDDYIHLALRCLLVDEASPGGWRAEQVSLVLGRGWVVTFQESNVALLAPLAKRLETSQSRLRKGGADYLAYAVLDAVVDTYFAVLENLGDRAEYVEDALLVHPTAQTLKDLHILKRESLAMRKTLWPMREVVGGLERLDSELVTPSIGVYLRDVYDHTVQIMDTGETLRDMLSGMLDIYLSSVSNRLNEVMKVLTVIATIFMPLSFIAGVYGMNFEYMPELKWHWGYFASLGLMAAVSLGMLVFFRRKKWF